MEVDEVLAFVNERHARSWTRRERLAGGYNQGAYAVEDTDGRAVFKWQPGPVPTGRTAAVADGVAAARAGGWPTPEWLAWGETPDGDAYHVVDFVTGATHPTVDGAMARSIVTAVDRQAGHAPSDGHDYSESARALLFDGVGQTLDRLAAFSPTTRQLVDAVRRATAPHADVTMPTGDLVHGNLDDENVLVRGTEVVAFVDVLAAGRGTRAYDLASLAVVSALWRWAPEAHETFVTAADAVAGPEVLLICACAQLVDVLDFGARHWPDDVDTLAMRAIDLVRRLAAASAFTDRGFHKVAPVPAGPRPSIYECRQPVRDWIGHLFDHHAPLPRGGRVLDAGCGPGAYVEAARARLGEDALLVAMDINADRVAMVDEAKAERLAGDVQALPFADGAFDAVLAMHMLYHVPDLPTAVRELRRVLRDGGVLYAFTNSERAQWELTELYLRHGGLDERAMGDARFSNESGGAVLADAFPSGDVELLELRESELVVTDPECIVDEFERLRYTLEPGLGGGSSWEALIDGVRADATATVRETGAFRMGEHHGLFICRKR